MGPELCALAEEQGYHPDLCSYARIDLGVSHSGRTPVGRLPKPDLLFASNNICQTVAYWYKVLAHQWKIPLILFATPYNFESIEDGDIAYMVRQLEEMIPRLEEISGRRPHQARFEEMLLLSRDASVLWGEVLATMKSTNHPRSGHSSRCAASGSAPSS